MADVYDVHQKLLSDTGLKLGNVLFYLLSAAQEMDRRSHVVQGGSRRLSEFGERVGNDEIFWWVHKREPSLEDLQTKVRETLPSLQALKVSSSSLESRQANSYADLVDLLAEFSGAHKKEITDIHQFVVWLHQRDPLSPVILFNYRVWGSTRMSDRWLELEGTSIDEVPVEVMRRLVEIVYGLFQ